MADATKAYTVVRRVRHDNTVYRIGEQIKLTQTQAARLLANGSITAEKVAPKADDNTAE
ncbi:hypothetical protein [Alicyclobacillus sp. ALC3]|uniref:hypothetical protein n=1 Tax=Alicyclobacillus sp. ALC3 TaxID=2796143 RepID=UPI0023799AEC|nr:hypothetical protein [Alicyclobacillus sp. ALC3]WDL96403.1 hypothetical protein JC200_19070 [Alicyclobacillus sp. ALC3]